MKTKQLQHSVIHSFLIGLLLSIPILSNAQSFECTSSLYQVVNGKELKVLIPSTGTYESIGTSSISYNGAGFNSQDGFIYGIGSGTTLVKVDNTGQASVVGSISGFSALSYSGDFDVDGNWYSFRKSGNSWIMNKLDVDDPSLAVERSSLTILNGVTVTSSTADIAYNAISNKFYGMNAGVLMEFDPFNQTVRALADYSNEAEYGGYGAVWSDETGKTYFFNNSTGNIYRAEFDENGNVISFAFLATSEPNGNNDGMGCALAQSPVFPEICDNGLDDDGDGLVDCEDPDCTGTESCGISGKVVSSDFACDQSIATYHTFFTNNSSLTNTITVTENLPTGFVFLQDTIEFDAEGYSDFTSQPTEGDQGVISWGQITLGGGETVRISYDVVLNESTNNGIQSNLVSVDAGNPGTLITPTTLTSAIEVGECPEVNTFSCEPAFYQVYKKKGKEEPNMFGKLNPTTGDYDPIAVASDYANGLGFDINTGLVYGASGKRFIQLDEDGIVIDMGISFAKNVYRGDINETSEWYGVVGSDVVKIDVLGTPQILDTYIGQGLPGWDIAYNMDGHFYSVHNQTLSQFNTSSNTKVVVGTISGNGLPTSGGYGAQWTGSDGHLYASHNKTGKVIQIDVTTLESRVVSLSVDGLSKNDGFSCPNEIPVVFEFDYGDNAHLPQSRILSYRQDLKQDDLPDLSTFWLGSTVNHEGSDPSNTDATGDLDDGFTMTTEIEDGTLTALFGLNSNMDGTIYYMMGIDWNDDGAFDEIATYSEYMNQPVTIVEEVSIPTGFEGGMVNVRIIATEVELSESSISGDLMELGEVEDYRYQITTPCTEDCDTTTGTNGGLESNGSLANAIARRNYTKVKNNSKSHLKAYQQDLSAFRQMRSVDENHLNSYFPAVGATGQETVTVSSPKDLVEITNATDVFAADYYLDDTRVAASLLLTTEQEVYNHSKNVCDRLNGKSIESTQLITINQIPVIFAKIGQGSNTGSAEYSAWFSVKDHGDKYEVFSQWNVDSYPSGSYLNFQVWSSSPKQVLHVLTHVMNELSQEKSIEAANNSSQLPRVMVKQGEYTNGQLKLTLLNRSAVTSVTLETNLRKTEQDDFTYEVFTLDLNGDTEQEVVIETGYLFDAGISLKTDNYEAYDALYLADGAWGTDFNQSMTLISEFNMMQVENSPEENEYLVERGFEISGSSSDVVNVFRNLKAGEKSLELNSYTSVSFEIQNSHDMEVILVEKGLVAWEDRLKIRIPAHSQKSQVILALEDFEGVRNTTVLDIQSVVFSYINQSGITESFEFSVEDLTFGNREVVMSTDQRTNDQVGFVMYPNPASDVIRINSSLANGNLMIFDMNGRMMVWSSLSEMENSNEIRLSLEPGLYHVRISNGTKNFSQKLIVK